MKKNKIFKWLNAYQKATANCIYDNKIAEAATLIMFAIIVATSVIGLFTWLIMESFETNALFGWGVLVLTLSPLWSIVSDEVNDVLEKDEEEKK